MDLADSVKAVFLGTPSVAVPSLAALLDDGIDVPLVITQPDRPAGRSRRPQAPPVKRFALERGVAVEQPPKVRGRAFRERIAALAPDVLVVVAFGRILPGKLIALPRLGAVNLHFSLLPKYRGAAPVQWALANGETTTGVTTMRINEALDEGDVLARQEVPVAPEEHAPQLAERLAAVGAALLVRTLRELDEGTLEGVPQDPRTATEAPLLRREDGWVDPARDSPERIEGRMRGFDPWPGVWVRHGGKRVRLVHGIGSPRSLAGVEPGRLTTGDDGESVLLACRGGSLSLLLVQPEGGRVMPARDAVNGRHLRLDLPLEALDG